MPDKTRTFLAIPVPDKIGEKLTRLQAQLAPDVPDVRWASATATAFHLTLAFLGDVADVDLVRLCRAVNDAAKPHAPFELRLEGLGCFPDPRKARVLWVGMTGPGLEPLARLQKEVAAAATQAGCPPEDNRFHPHITLGRIKVGRGPARDLSPILRHHQTWSAGSFRVSEAVVFASTLAPEGPIYAPLSTARLEGEKPETSP